MSQKSELNGGIAEAVDAGTLILRKVQRFNWALLALLTAGSWYLYNSVVSQSILVGGIIANASFFMLSRDIGEFIAAFSDAGLNWKAIRRFEKVKFFLKFYARLVVMGLVLYLLITKMTIDVIGLVIGLSTVMFSVIVVVLSRGKLFYSAQRYKGA